MKLALVLVAALAAPVQDSEPDFLSMDAGEDARCMAPEGCIIITKNAMRDLIEEIEHTAAMVCRKTI